MSESHELGRQGEELALNYLKNKGYNILLRNWTWGRHEIDLIIENHDFIVFTEVKTRSGNFHEHPRAAVTNEKQKSIIRAAEGYIQKFRIDKESRFDVITVIKQDNGFEIDHIEDAFYPTLR